MRYTHFATPFLFFLAWLLLLLVTLSVPIIKSIYMFQIGANISVGSGLFSASAQAAVKFGIFGWCSNAIKASVATFSENQPAECSPRHLGYTLDATVQKILSSLDVKDLGDVISKGLTVVLILHPIACGLAFLGLLLSLFTVFRTHRIASALATATGILAAFLATLAFILDSVLVGVVKSRIHSKTSGRAYAKYGNAEWLTLVAAIALWGAVVGACCGIIRTRRQRATEKY